MLTPDLDLDRNLTRDALTQSAARRRGAAHGRVDSYSPKVFIPLAKLVEPEAVSEL